MKHILFLFFLIASQSAFAQKLDVRNAGEKLTIQIDRTVLIQRDTSESGIVTITLKPTDELAKEMQEKVEGLQAEVARLDALKNHIDQQGNVIRDEKKSINRQIREINTLINGLDVGGRSAIPPTQKASKSATIPVKKKQ